MGIECSGFNGRLGRLDWENSVDFLCGLGAVWDWGGGIDFLVMGSVDSGGIGVVFQRGMGRGVGLGQWRRVFGV